MTMTDGIQDVLEQRDRRRLSSAAMHPRVTVRLARTHRCWSAHMHGCASILRVVSTRA